MKRFYVRALVAISTFIFGAIVSLVALKVYNYFHHSAVEIKTAPPQSISPAPMLQLVSTPKSPIAQTVAKMRESKVDVGDDEIPAPVKPLLTILKHQLRDLITESLNSSKDGQVDAELVRQSIISDLEEDGVHVAEPKEEVVTDLQSYLAAGYTYGEVYDISIQHPANNPNLIAATTSIGVCCGDDTSLYIYRYQGGEWKLILAQESNDYPEIDGAQGTFQYAVSTPDAHQNFFVVTANVNPWCTSNWQMLRYKVLRPSANPYKPRILLQKKDEIYLGVDPPIYTLKLRGNLFSLRFYGEKMEKIEIAGDGDSKNAYENVKYRISGNKAVFLSR